jgi:prefoldin subunit 5
MIAFRKFAALGAALYLMAGTSVSTYAFDQVGDFLKKGSNDHTLQVGKELSAPTPMSDALSLAKDAIDDLQKYKAALEERVKELEKRVKELEEKLEACQAQVEGSKKTSP